MNAYATLEQHFRQIGHLNHVAAIAEWDEAAMMPAGAGSARGEALATLGVTIHGLVTDPRMPDLLADARSDNTLDAWQRANVEAIHREWLEASCRPPDLVRALSESSSRCEQAWRKLRAANDWAGIRPLLEELVGLVRQEATLMGEVKHMAPYDALVDRYEAGIGEREINAWFEPLKTFLPGFVEQVIERQAARPATVLRGPFPVEAQRELALHMMRTLGFDFDHGRLDVSHHPFCGGVPDDTRITTRYNDDVFLESLMAVLHETGHAMYEQGLPPAWRNQPVGTALGMAIHESQSLLMEMQACRSAEFMRFAAPHIRETLGGSDTDPAWQPDNLHRLATHVERSYIRVEADEVTYPLHVIARYEIERDLLAGRLEVRDLPEVWDANMQRLLGLKTGDNYTDGVMQDVHWYAGLIGYFPTYTIGAMTAAQLFQAAGRALSDLPQQIEQGDFSALLGWLRKHVHSQGRSVSATELLRAATGADLDPGCFRRHLEARYG